MVRKKGVFKIILRLRFGKFSLHQQDIVAGNFQFRRGDILV